MKYRIYDLEKQKYYEPINKAYKGELYQLYLSPSGTLTRRTYNSFEDESVFKGRYIVELSTGLLDKNGVEYCENDIVILGSSKAIIKWDKQFVMFYFDVIDEDNWCEDWSFQDDLDRFEIIGNIHDTSKED